MVMGAVVARILTQYSDKGSKQAQKDIAKLQKRIDAFGKKAAKSFAVAAVAGAAFAVKIGKDSVKAAIEQGKSQALLANNLKNSLGATDAQIAAIEKYIDKTELLTNVQDTELRSSFSQLAIAFGNITDATLAQGVALDVAAGTGKDLSLVSDAITKASQGNFTALKKLVPTLDANIVKNKDLGKALVYLDKTYKGAAKAAADRDPWTKLEVAFGNLQKKLGVVLLPIVIDFTTYLIEEVIPALEDWIALNQDQLQQSLQDVTDILKDFIKQGPTILQLLKSLADIMSILNTPILGLTSLFNFVVYGILAKRAWSGLSKIFGGINTEVLVTGKRYDVVAKKQGIIVKGLQWILSKGKVIAGVIYAIATAFTTMGIRAGIAAIGVALATAGANIYAALPALAAIGVTIFATKRYMDSLSESTDKASNSVKNFGSVSRQAIAGPAALAKAQAQAAAEEAARLAKLKAMQAEQDKKDKEAAARAKLVLKLQTQINKLTGQKVKTEDDPIQLEAARLLLLKQGALAAAELEKLKRMQDEILLAKVRNDLTQRYVDLLQVLSDKEITSEEILVLSKKWGIAKEAVEAYILQFNIISDAYISNEEITKLAKSWGSTEAQAAQYLDFLMYLNDSILSDAEIEKLKKKWGLTEEQVRMYADFVGIVNDGKLEDAEIIKIKDKWKLTTDQVVAYLLKLGAPVTYNGNLIEPGRLAELAWKDAKTALEAYLKLLGQGTGQNGGLGASDKPAGMTDAEWAKIIADANNAAAEATAAAADAAATAAEAEAAAAAAAAALASSSTLGAISSAKTTKEINDAVNLAAILGESASDIANAMMTGLLGQGVSAANAASSARYTGQAIAAQQAAMAKAAEEAALAQSRADAFQRYRAAERADFAAGLTSSLESATLTNSRSIMSSGGGNLMAGSGAVVNITVQGSVTSENDLVDAVRNGLLATQYNGNSINLQAV